MTTFDAALDAARKLGTEHGHARGTWVFDGNTSRETYRRVLTGINDGDPEVLDQLPSAPLSGEWAGDYLLGDLYRDVDWPEDDDDTGEIADAYETAWNDAMMAEVERAARYQLDD